MKKEKWFLIFDYSSAWYQHGRAMIYYTHNYNLTDEEFKGYIKKFSNQLYLFEIENLDIIKQIKGLSEEIEELDLKKYLEIDIKQNISVLDDYDKMIEKEKDSLKISKLKKYKYDLKESNEKMNNIKKLI